MKLRLILIFLSCLPLLRAENLTPNAGFEADAFDAWAHAGADGVPDGWWPRPYMHRETNPAHVRSGAAALRIDGPANPASTPNYNFWAGDYNMGFAKLDENATYIMGGLRRGDR